MEPLLTIAFTGILGAGKSTTIDALFGTRFADGRHWLHGHTVQQVELYAAEHTVRSGAALRVVELADAGDTPSIGADASRLYHARLTQCDAALWVVAASQLMSGDLELSLRRLPVGICSRLVIGINQVEQVAPQDWNDAFNIPSRRQEDALRDAVAAFRARVYAELAGNVPFVSFSARRGYRLELLFHTLLERCSGQHDAVVARLALLSHQQLTPHAGL